MSGDKLREAEQTVEKADNAALEIAVKYERSPDFENSEDLKRAVRVLRVPDEAYAFVGATGRHPLPMSVPSDITEAWDRQKKARDDRFNAQQQPLVQPPPDE